MSDLGLRVKQPGVSQTVRAAQRLKQVCFSKASCSLQLALHTDVGAHDEAERWCVLGSWLRGPVLLGHQILPVCPSRC